MFFVRINRLRHTLAFRLTLWYTTLFAVLALIVFILFYVLTASVIYQRTDDNLFAQRNRLYAGYNFQGVNMLLRTAALQAQAIGEKKIFYRFFYPSGVVFSSSNMSYWKGIGIDRGAVEDVLVRNTHAYVTHRIAGSDFKVRVLYARIGNAVILQLGSSLEEEQRLLLALKKIFMVTLSGMLVLAILGGWFMSHRALSGVAMVTRTAQQISEDDLNTRVPVRHRHNEIDRLAITFNQMLDRIQILVAGICQMNDNIAHDLRSPITRIRGLAEVTLTSASGQDEYRQMAASTVEECDRLLDMINTMLTISRTEAGVSPVERIPVDLAAVVGEACELFQPLAEEKSVELKMRISGRAELAGDQRMLQRMVANLIDNAIKYTPAGGRILVELASNSAKQFRLTVQDTGIGISAEDQPRVFERFFRSDQARTRGGAGLGLSLAQAIVRVHGGRIAVQSELHKGSTFTIELPAAS
ncbi:MAG: ATP-binding protein [Desulfobacteraceae bacterium]